jgi:hypothetical protein
MNYQVKDYPHLVQVISTDAFNMSWVCDNLTGKCFRISNEKLKPTT